MKAILNAKLKTISFTFKDELFTIDLKEGDLHDNWNSIILSNGIIYDTNFDWYLKPQLSLYRCGDEEQQYDDSTLIDDFTIVGTKADYFDLEFDSELSSVFILFAENGEVKIISKSLNTISDRKEENDYIICIDNNGATKTIY